MKTITAPEAPKTEGIKYAGSKLRLIPHILRLAAKTGAKSVFDGFSGTTRVSQAFAKNGYSVTANDSAVWSEVFGRCYLINSRGAAYFEPLIDHLNALPGKEGWFSETYGGSVDSEISSDGDGLKKPFQIHNMRKLDAIREEIDLLPVTEDDRCVLLTSLILALDRVDNTIGHFASYLSQWSPRSYGELELRLPDLLRNTGEHKVLKRDAVEAAGDVDCELAYYDPPYGSNNEKMPPSRVRYSSYYHFWSSVILNDRPETFGKAKRREDSSDKVALSAFEEFRQNEDGRYLAVEAIEKLLANTKARDVILSYSSRGRATSAELKEVLSQAGEIDEFVQVDYRSNVMANMCWTNDWTRNAKNKNQEYLFLLRKR
ncbi:MAG: DNA adenine methylase [Acidobacteriota bacterium]|nr:DNA adenine methylase [Acidobacteriota bacterium]MDH3528675.1 DNA adenine methylase [Acidobacteriota bacterium]